MIFILAKMQSDVTLECENKIPIIDTKYYGSNLSKNYGKDIHHSSNLYQIFTYVKNKELELQANGYEISGMLLYVRTTSEIQPDSDYVMSGNKISVKTMDLNKDFKKIKMQLDYIAKNFQGVENG